MYGNEPKLCPDCGGRGYTLSDPDGKQLMCQTCGGDGLESAIRVLEAAGKKPKIICLCGSTRFTEQMLIKQWELTKQGNIVLSWCALPDSYFAGEDKNHIGDQEGVKQIVDEVHKRKIDLADEVFVINVDGYVGESTRSEIKYAIEHGKPIRWLEPDSSEAILRSLEALPDKEEK